MRTTRPGLVLPVRVDPEGRVGPTRHQTRGTGWRRTSRGLYVPARVPRSVEQRILEACAVLPSHGGVTGWASLRWRGGRWFDGIGAAGLERAVPLVTSCDDIRSQPGIAVSAERLDPSDIEFVDGVRTTSAVRSVLLEMRTAESVRDAVAVLDLAAYSDLVSIDEVRTHAERLAGWTGIPQARSAIALSCENAWSPMEVAVRLLWVVDAGLPPLLANHPVFDRHGRHVATPDLLDLEACLAIEYDGAAHLDGRRRAGDIEREEALRGLGLSVVLVVAAQLPQREKLVARLQQARAAAPHTPVSLRRWTVETPRGWRPTTSVALRRSLDPRSAGRLLAYRRAA